MRLELHDQAAQRASRNRVNVVETDDTVRRDTILACGKGEFGYETPDRARGRSNDYRSNAICDRISRENEDGSIAAWGGGEPQFTASHRPSRTSLLRGPSRQSGRWPTRPG